jgi:hypothetical protein
VQEAFRALMHVVMLFVDDDADQDNEVDNREALAAPSMSSVSSAGEFFEVEAA